MYREGLAMAENYWGLHDAFEGWLTSAEAKVSSPPTMQGNPQLIHQALEELQALHDEVTAHQSHLDDVVSAGHELEAFPAHHGGSSPDVGYYVLQQKYESLKVSW